MRRSVLVGLVCAGLLWASLGVQGQEPAAAPAAAMTTVAPGLEAPKEVVEDSGSPQFFQVVFGSGPFGVLIWVGLFACSIAGVALVVDQFITVRAKKIIPEALVAQVREAMGEGDVMKAMKRCEEDPGPMANILLAGFSNVEEGFDVIQQAIGAAADLESEKLLQRVTYLSVDSNLAPMLGLLGTVQGMIMAFGGIAMGGAGGAAQTSLLALAIAQALWTTAAGLVVAIPVLGFFFFFRNRANKIILSMEMITLDLIKALRNVEVVEE